MKSTTAVLFMGAWFAVYPVRLQAETLQLDYSTYLGGNGEDWGYGIALGTGGEAYVTGGTNSPDFPTNNPYQASWGEAYLIDAFVTRLSSSGSALIYSTYLGGSGDEYGFGIALGAGGEAHVTGYTNSPNFPTNNPYQAVSGGSWDAFVCSISPSGSFLIYSTYLGGSKVDEGRGITLGTGGGAYVTGATESPNFPTNNPFQAGHGVYEDAFVSRLSSSGSGLVFSTYLGGNSVDYGEGIALGTGGEAYIAVYTGSTDFPTNIPYQASSGGGDRDVFVSRLSSSGSGLVFSTYLGGNSVDYGEGIALGTGGEVYVAGHTGSPNFPTNNPYQASCKGAYDVFVSKLFSSGAGLIYSTYLGGDDFDRGYGIALGAGGEAYVVGYTRSLNFPTNHPWQAGSGGGWDDVSVSGLSSSGSSLVYSTYLGGMGSDQGYGIALGTGGEAHVTGYTNSANFPTNNPYQAGFGGYEDAFVSKLIFVPTPTPSPTASISPPRLATPTPAASASPSPSAPMSPTPPVLSTPPPTPASFSGGILILGYSTYLGGDSGEWGEGITLGTGGEAYVTGGTLSLNFPTNNPYQESLAGGDDLVNVFVSMLSSSGSILIYSTYLGGNTEEWGDGIALGSGGEAYITGQTSSTDFPTKNPFQASFDGEKDVFMSSISSNGSSLIFSTYLGGNGFDGGSGIALGTGGEAFVTGSTRSSNFPTKNPYQANLSGGENVFVSKLSSDGSALIYSTHLGGDSSEWGDGITLGAGGEAYVTGSTLSPNFPTKNPYQATLSRGENVFVSKLSSDGSALIYSTYLGGNEEDHGHGIALGTGNEVYVAGDTSSPNFPTKNPYQASLTGNQNAFVSKLSSAGSALIYSTYLGGDETEWGDGIALGTGGEAYVTGGTCSLNFPTKNPYQASLGEIYMSDVFISMLSPSGSALVYSTYLGGNDEDYGHGIALGTGNEVYVTGDTPSTNFPTKNPYQASLAGNQNAFVSKLIFVLTATPTPVPVSGGILELDYSTYLGGSNEDHGFGIALGTGGEAHVTGLAYSSNFPIKNPYQAGSAGNADVFVGKLSSSGSGLIYSTYLGGSGNDYGFGIILGSGGEAYIAGDTYSTNFPTKNPYQASWAGLGDVFVIKLFSSGSALIYSTYLGGNGLDDGSGIALGTAGEAYITGGTYSADFPTINPYQASSAGNRNVFVSRLSSSGSSLIYSTYLGGSDDDEGYGITLGTGSEAYVTGMTWSANFPRKNPYQTSSGGASDAFVSKLSSGGSALIYSTYLGGNDADSGGGIMLGAGDEAHVTGGTYSLNFPTINPYQAGFGGNADVFVSRLSSSGSGLIYSTYLGGNDEECGYGIAIGSGGETYIAGETGSTDFPTINTYQASLEEETMHDAFVTMLFSSGSALIYSTYLGGNDEDYGRGIALGTGGEAYITGIAISRNFPTKNPYQASYGGNEDAFVTKLIFTMASPSAAPTPSAVSTPSPTPAPSTTSSPSPTPRVTTPSPSPASTTTPSPSPSPTPTSRPATPTPRRLVIDADDYDGDGCTDLGLWRTIDGSWRIRNVSLLYYGLDGDIPVCGDYNGDGTADIAVFRPSSGQWYIRNPSGGTLAKVYYGQKGDMPVPADYSGDFRTDTAVFRCSTGGWYISGRTRFFFGLVGDRPVPGDYNGDGRADPAVFRSSSSSGVWYIRGISQKAWGLAGDCVAPGDYDGDGTTEISLFRSAVGRWYTLGSGSVVFGRSGDIPVVIDCEGDGTQDRALYRPSEGRWYIYGVTAISYGTNVDQPVVGRIY